MPVLTRRSAIYASGCALTTPLVGKLLVGTASGQSAAPTLIRSASPSNVLNPDLQAYAVSNVPRLLAKAGQGSLGAQDYQDLSNRLHLFARHVDAVNTEPFRTALVSSLDTSSAVDLSQRPEASELYAAILAHDPSASYSDFQQSLKLSPDHLALGKRALAANSIAWHLHTVADGSKWLGAQKAQGAAIGVVPATFDPQQWHRGPLSHAIYHPDFSDGLMRVRGLPGVCGLTAKQWCQLAALIVAASLALAVIIADVPGTAAAAVVAAIAENLGWTIKAVIAAAKIAALIAGALGSLCGIFLS